MKIVVNGRLLADALALVGRAVPSRTPRPILQNVGIEAHGERVTLSGTDLELAIRCQMEEVEIAAEGNILVPCARLMAIVKELQHERIELEARPGALDIRAAGARFSLTTESAADYPALPFPTKMKAAKVPVPRDVLLRLVRRVSFAAASEQARFALNGVLLRLRDRQIRLVATDGKRLALTEAVLSDAPDEAVLDVVVPTRALDVLTQLPLQEGESIRLAVHGGHILALANRVELAGRLVEGQFPPYEEVIPKEQARSAEVATAGLLDAVRQASVLVLATRETRAVRFQFRPDRLTLVSRVANVGEGEVEIPISYAGEPVDIGFNPVYFQEFLQRIDEPVVTIAFGEPDGPATLRAGPTGLYLVMPIDLYEEIPAAGVEAEAEARTEE